MITNEIIKIASNTKYYGLKNLFNYKSNYKNKKCGDIIKIELVVKKDRISSMRYETESCVLCDASASILANYINLFSISNLNRDIYMLSKYFRNNKIQMPKKYKIFKKILSNNNIDRFDCVMMPFYALKKALKI